MSSRPPTTRLDHLEWLEAEAIYILREVAANSQNRRSSSPGARIAACVLRLAEKAFRPGQFPFPLLHIDTGHNYPEVLGFRDARPPPSTRADRALGRGLDRAGDRPAPRRARFAQRCPVGDAAGSHRQGWVRCPDRGARRDEEKARAKERIFSFRDSFGQWDPKNQRPELLDLYNTRIHPGENLRVFPISNWTVRRLAVHRAGASAAAGLYFAHEREVFAGAGCSCRSRRSRRRARTRDRAAVGAFRTVGDIGCTCPVASEAATVDATSRSARTCWKRHPSLPTRVRLRRSRRRRHPA